MNCSNSTVNIVILLPNGKTMVQNFDLSEVPAELIGDSVKWAIYNYQGYRMPAKGFQEVK